MGTDKTINTSEAEKADLVAKAATKHIKYLGPFSEVSIDDSGPTVKRGETVELSAYLADPLLKDRSDEWELVKSPKKDKHK
jgi:hypothetical protein